MKLLGLNSPEIFIILVILLSILGPKRIEKGFLLFKKLLKFLLSKDEDQSSANSEVKPEEAEESEVKEETVELEVKAEDYADDALFEAKVEKVITVEEYELFFKKALKKFGVSSPAELKTAEKKKEFFNYIDDNFKAKNEKD